MAIYQISCLEPSLQSKTRAERDGVNIEMVAGALNHDLGDVLALSNHSQVAPAIIRPCVRNEVPWIIEHHGVFQMHYDGDTLSFDKSARKI